MKKVVRFILKQLKQKNFLPSQKKPVLQSQKQQEMKQLWKKLWKLLKNLQLKKLWLRNLLKMNMLQSFLFLQNLWLLKQVKKMQKKPALQNRLKKNL